MPLTDYGAVLKYVYLVKVTAGCRFLHIPLAAKLAFRSSFSTAFNREVWYGLQRFDLYWALHPSWGAQARRSQLSLYKTGPWKQKVSCPNVHQVQAVVMISLACPCPCRVVCVGSSRDGTACMCAALWLASHGDDVYQCIPMWIKQRLCLVRKI